jgi:hypothetical protein
MAIRIVEIHPADEPEALNTEWFILENQGEKPFSTRTCSLQVRRKGSKKKTQLGTIDPGFILASGERMRVTTGHPGRKAHGKPPDDGVPFYSLFLNESILRGPGCVVTLALRSLPVAQATFDPDSEHGVLAKKA